MPDKSLHEIDWDSVWEKAMERTTLKGEGIKFWDKAAPCLSKNYSCQNNYVEQLLKRMMLGSGKTILDVGCGTGTMALSLSKHARQITALDHSQAMLDFLNNEISDRDITNIRILNADFIEADPEVVGKHDIVLASRSLPMGNLRKSLLKMEALSSSQCYLTWIASSRKLDADVCRIMGRPYFPYPSYLIIANMLYTMGIYAGIELFQVNNNQVYGSLDEAVDSVLRGKEISNEHKQQICDFFSTIMKRTSDGWEYSFTDRWALIWWQKTEL
ncbi:MAG: class I SAM-dependent methyltransferase [Dehalococcoidales bacterium]